MKWNELKKIKKEFKEINKTIKNSGMYDQAKKVYELVNRVERYCDLNAFPTFKIECQSAFITIDFKTSGYDIHSEDVKITLYDKLLYKFYEIELNNSLEYFYIAIRTSNFPWEKLIKQLNDVFHSENKYFVKIE